MRRNSGKGKAMIFDSHSHTEYSGDSDMKAADALAAAGTLGLGLVFTEHLDLAYPGPISFTFDPRTYWEEYEPLRGDRLRLGVEIGMWDRTCEGSREFVGMAPFDLVIGSVHLIDGKDLYYKEAYGDEDKASFYRRYYRQMAENVRLHSFIDVMGHIDYIARYAPYDNPEVDYGTFQEEIDDVLQALIDTDTVLELNMRRLGEKLALKELVPIYRRYREMGGRFITLGSDAHAADAVGMNFAAAQDFAAALGLQIVTFCQRRLEICRE